jgi:hypothetical protein
MRRTCNAQATRAIIVRGQGNGRNGLGDGEGDGNGNGNGNGDGNGNGNGNGNSDLARWLHSEFCLRPPTSDLRLNA